MNPVQPDLQECGICFCSETEDFSKITPMSCCGGGFYHQTCLKTWLAVKNVCPICKRETEKPHASISVLSRLRVPPTPFHRSLSGKIKEISISRNFTRDPQRFSGQRTICEVYISSRRAY